MGVHVLDSAWWLMGMPKPVSALGAAGAALARPGVLGLSPPAPGIIVVRRRDYGGALSASRTVPACKL